MGLAVERNSKGQEALLGASLAMPNGQGSPALLVAVCGLGFGHRV